MSHLIPFNRIFKDEAEQDAACRVINGDTWHGDGPVSKRVEAQLAEWLESKYVYLTTSCTHALEMAMMALDIEQGDEVILPGFTFVSTANAIRMQGAIPVFAEIRSQDLTIDPLDVEKKISSATRAIIPIHYAGVSADMKSLQDLADRHQTEHQNIAIVEDAAQAVGAWSDSRALGTIGDIGCFSFHDTKNFTCGEGGAFLTQNGDIARKAEWIREKGTNRSAFLRGEIDKYTWVSKGSSYIPSDILAGVLEVQLQKREMILERRKKVWFDYHNRLLEAKEYGWIDLPAIPSHAQSNYHIFYFHVKDPEDRGPLLQSLRSEGIEATFHYVPLHNAPYARKVIDTPLSLPRTEYLANTLIRLPIYPDLAKESEQVADRVYKVLVDYHC